VTPAGSCAINAACEVPEMAAEINPAIVIAKIVRIIVFFSDLAASAVPAPPLTLHVAMKLRAKVDRQSGTRIGF
jgi:hypothetical protein